MFRKLLPIFLAVMGIAAGIGAGLVYVPSDNAHDSDMSENECAPVGEQLRGSNSPPRRGRINSEREYVKLNNQFVVPVMGETRVKALVVASLSVEVNLGATEQVYAEEPKLRDAFLQVMFDHANIGGFDGNFTAGQNMNVLRNALYEVAYSVLGDEVSDVLITEIARQDT